MSGNGTSNGTSSWCVEFEKEALCVSLYGRLLQDRKASVSLVHIMNMGVAIQ